MNALRQNTKSRSKKFTKTDYKRLDRLAKSQKKAKALKVTPEYIDSLTK